MLRLTQLSNSVFLAPLYGLLLVCKRVESLLHRLANVGNNLWRMRLICVAVLGCVEHLAYRRRDFVRLMTMLREVTCKTVTRLQILQDGRDALFGFKVWDV
jgi:hypothetical protein